MHLIDSFLKDIYQQKEFIDLYKSGQSIRLIAQHLNIPERRAYWFKEKLNLETIPKWARLRSEISEVEKQVIHGSLLGDASLRKRAKSKTFEFSITHGPKQIDYLEWKRQKLIDLNPGKICSAYDKYGSKRFHLSHHPYFEELRDQHYLNDRKYISQDSLNNLDPLGLAVWFMDDGNSFSHGYGLATCSFKEKEHEIIKTYFQTKWNIKIKVTNYDYPRILFQKEESFIFKSLIQDHIIDSMRYKLIREGIDKKK